MRELPSLAGLDANFSIEREFFDAVLCENGRCFFHFMLHDFVLFNFAVEGITGFSVVPLRLASYAGFLTAFSAFVYALFLLVKTLTIGDSVKGFPTLILTILILMNKKMMKNGKRN